MTRHATQAFARLAEIIIQLRAPDGCPWDREQTPQTMRRHLLEETYECIEAIETGSPADIEEELGDLYMLVTMIATMYQELDRFTIADALENVSDKLVRRHPHVFGDAAVSSTDEVLEQWQRIKTEQEGKRPATGHLDGVSRAMPSLERAYKLQRKAAKVGFDWPTLEGVRDKLLEEVAEVIDELGGSSSLASGPRADDSAHDELEQEVGDLLFSVVNVARYLGVDPSTALNRANRKFVDRFHAVESRMKELGKQMSAAELELMDRLWNETKPAARTQKDTR